MNRIALVAFLALCACEDDTIPLDWRVSFASASLAARATAVEAVISRGSCAAPFDDVVYRAEVTRGLPPPSPPALDPGSYVIGARARDADCLWFASRCTEIELGASEVERSVELILTEDDAPTPTCDRPPCAACRGDDAEVDAAIDAEVDAAVDAEVDAAIDAEVDAAVDAEVDAYVDAEVDAYVDAGLPRPDTSATGKSCAELLADGATEDGVYQLVDDEGAVDAYCDMTTLGGGWTLIMKLSNDSEERFGYTSRYWDEETTYRSDDLRPNDSPRGINAKLEAFNLVKGDELRLEWLAPADHDFTYDGLDGRTALELFRGPEVLVVGSEAPMCQAELLASAPGYDADFMRHARGHQFFGINGEDTTSECGPNRMRFGFASNDEATGPWNPLQGIGVSSGCADGIEFEALWVPSADCSSCGGCYGSPYSASRTSANLWVR